MSVVKLRQFALCSSIENPSGDRLTAAGQKKRDAIRPDDRLSKNQLQF
jgi:hypothetical protein